MATRSSDGSGTSLRFVSDKCPRCFVLFDFIKRAGNSVSKLPLILPCNHVLCEDCLHKLTIKDTNRCVVCQQQFAIPKTHLNRLCEIFTPHYTLIGYLLLTKNTHTNCKFDMVPSGRTIRERQQNIARRSISNSELSESEYDDNSIDIDTDYLKFKVCTEHSGEDNNIYCRTCLVAICSYCFIENHIGHTPIHLYKLTDEEQSQLKDSVTHLKTVLNTLHQSLKKLNEIQTADYTDLKREIKKYFIEYHGKLHLIEKQLYDQLNHLNIKNNENNDDDNSSSNSNNGDGNDIIDRMEIQQTINRINRILSIYKSLKSTKTKKSFNIKGLLKEVENLKNIPCQLVVQDGEDNNEQPVQFVANNDLEQLESKFRISQLNSTNYQLIPYESQDRSSTTLSSSSLNNDDQQQQQQQNLLTAKEEEGCENDLTTQNDQEASSYEMEECLTDVVHDELQELQLQQSPEKNRDKMKQVIITHLNDFDSFYVQPIQSQSKLNELSTRLRRLPKKNMRADKLIINNLYLVQYIIKGHNYWRRGRLNRIITNNNNDNNDNLYEIFFIDYGNTQICTIDKLCQLNYYTHRQPFVWHCKLKRPTNIEWNQVTRLNFIQIVKNKELLMKRCKTDPQTTTTVELFVRDSNDCLIQIVDLLLNQMVNIEKSLKKTRKLYRNTTVFVEGQQEYVKITKINDPLNIYIQLVRNLKYLEELRRNMENYFKKHQRNSCIPIERSDVIVKYDNLDQGQWYRAHVQNVCLSEKTAFVFLVDYGHLTNLSWSDIKQLPEEFCRFETQAIQIKLADIKCCNNQWSDQIINFLNEQLLNKTIRMVITNVKQSPLEVGLFKLCENGEICINALLVDEKLADTIGTMSETLFWPTIPHENSKFDEDLILSKLLTDRENELATATIDDRNVKFGYKANISIVSFISPDLIYIKFQSNYDKEELMHKELQIHYNQVRTTKQSWKTQELCVIWDEANSTYYRAVIRRKLPTFHRYCVYLYDELREIELDNSSIFVYEPYFQANYLDFVYKCYLAGIRPAGDGKQWPRAAIEAFEQLLKNRQDFYVKKVEDRPKSKIFGVIMWYCLTKSGTALQPTTKRFISINQLFIELGLALSNKQVTTIDQIVKKLDAEPPTQIEECLTKSWPNYLPIKHREFDAKIVCVDSNGIFYLRSDEFDQLYKELETIIKQQFDKNNNQKNVPNSNWKYGDMCTIKYENYWYRGTILEVIDLFKIKVEMIDFASEHIVDVNDLSPQIMYPDVEPLIQRVRLFNIFPAKGDYWPITVNEKIYTLIENQVHVIIKGDLKQTLPLAEFYTRNGTNLNQLLVDHCDELIGYNKSIKATEDDNLNDLETIVIDDDDDDWADSGEIVEKFYYPPLQIGQILEMYVLNVFKYNEIVLCYNKNHPKNDLESLTEMIEKTIDEQPMLDEPCINQPCVAFIKQEKKWGRGKILNLNSYGFATVFFVDYAIIEMILLSDIKQIKPEWLNMLVHNYIATICVELTSVIEQNRYLNRLKQLIDHLVFVEIINDDPLIIQLFDKKEEK